MKYKLSRKVKKMLKSMLITVEYLDWKAHDFSKDYSNVETILNNQSKAIIEKAGKYV